MNQISYILYYKIPAVYLSLLRGERSIDLELKEELQPMLNIELRQIYSKSLVSRNQQRPISNALSLKLNAKIFYFNDVSVCYEPGLENLE